MAGLFGKAGLRHSREQEISTLRKTVGHRPLGLSESGYNLRDYDEAQAAAHMAWERAFFERVGFDFAVVYQINSGDPASTHHDSHFGFRRPDLSWRPISEQWTGRANA